MTDRQYYSVRTGSNPYSHNWDLPALLMLMGDVYQNFDRLDYFQEAFGKHCVDEGHIPGRAGSDIGMYVFRKLRKAGLWPIVENMPNYSEDDVFDVLEFLYDLVSKPLEGRYHSWDNCGYHYNTFDRNAGREEFRREINDLLCDFRDGYELSKQGEILSLGAEQLRPLLEQELPEYDTENVDSRVKSAVRKFRHHTPKVEDKREAVRQLADVLEFLRDKLRGILPSKDEDDLFNIANNFGIRHHNLKQKTEYDKEIWLDWVFYCYLNTVHVAVRLLKQTEAEA